MDLALLMNRQGRLNADLYRQLKEAVIDGRLRAGESLPATRALAAQLGVGRNTVIHAYQQLIAEGYLQGKVGAGTFVRSDIGVNKQRRAPAGTVLRPRPAFRAPATSVAAAPRTPWDFQIGLPDPALFPWDEWRRLLARQLRRPSRTIGYPAPEGEPRARAAIARHLGLSRSVQAGEGDVLITSGAQQALDLVGRVLLEPGSCVAVEEPGYLPAKRLFRSLGARVVGARVDAEGIVVDELPRDARLVYVTPSHQFPLGVPMSLSRRLALLEWSARTGAAIVEDDYDSEFRFDGRPLEPLQSLDRHGRVLYVGTFSKVLLPTLRLGFVVAPASLMPSLHAAKALSDWHCPPEPQRALAELIDDGLFARHIRRLTKIYGERRQRMIAAIERELGDAVEQFPSVAGLHHSFRLRNQRTDAEAIVQRALEARVIVQGLAGYYEHKPVQGIALGYGLAQASNVEEGIRKLAACFAPKLSRSK